MNELNIMDIKDIELGSIITRVYPTPRKFGRDGSYIGDKLELIGFDKTDIILKSYEYNSIRENLQLPIERYRYGWRKYVLFGGEKYDKVPYSNHKIQLRLQHIYIGFDLEKNRGRNSEQFGDYLLVCRYLEKILKSHER